MSIWIAGIGTATPTHSIAQLDAAEIAKTYACDDPSQQRAVVALYRRAGVRTRHSIVLDASDGPLDARQSFYPPRAGLEDSGPTTRARMERYEAEAGALAVAACRRALADASVGPERITSVVTVSCSGFYAPGFDVELAARLPLRPNVTRTHIGFMGCHAALNGLRVARAFLEADGGAVLVCAVELCSLHHQYGWDPDQIVANALFSDGAAAVVVLRGENGAPESFELIDSSSTILEDSRDAMTWRIGDHGFVMTLSTQAPDLITRCVRPWLEAWLRANELDVASIGSWAIHPGGPRIVSAFGDAVGVDRGALAPSLEVLARFGNMSSPTILFLLDELRGRCARRPCVALAFGPGLTIEGALFG